MSWAALASNQCVSCNNLQDAVNNGVFVLKNTIPSSAKQITTTEAEYYVYINTIYKSSNELVVKSNLVSSGTYYTWYLCTPSSAPCTIVGPYTTVVYSNNPSFLSYAIFYTNTALTNAFNGGNNWFADSTFESGTTICINRIGQTIDQNAC